MTLKVADLFAGAGGASTGLQLAAKALGQSLDLVAVNHWRAAVDTHAANHPDARHLCEAIERVDPRDAVPGGKLDLLMAGPSCTQHSPAKGGRALDDKDRSSAWQIPRWLDLLQVNRVLVENVPAFTAWAPLDARRRPMRSKRGQVFQAWIAAIEAMHYRVEVRELNAADYGEPQTRVRVWIQAVRKPGRIVWPEPTHSPHGATSLFRASERWRGAREVIDWSLPAKAVDDPSRPKPLSAQTLRKIDIGLRRFSGRPFVIGQHGGSVARDVSLPLPTIATDGAIHLCEPFTLPYNSNGGDIARPVSQPLGTVTTRDRFALIIPDATGVRHRMLRTHELSAAMGFPSDYRFIGTQSDVKKMIGNAWSVRTAEALCRVILEQVIPQRKPRREAVA